MAYFVLPAPGWGFLSSGRPLNWLGMVAVSATCWLWWSRRRLPLAALFLAALGMKLASAPIVPPHGFRAAYHAEADWQGPVEAGSTRGASFTRIDERLQFEDTRHDFPLYFFNDTRRFNFYQPGEPQRDKLAFSVSWLGFLYQPEAEDRRLYLAASGTTARVAIGRP